MLNFAFMQLLYSFTVAMLLTAVLMPLAIHFAPVLGLVDIPDARKVHTKAIPRCGGLAMTIGIAAPLLWYLPSISPMMHLLIAATIIIAFGALDDRNNLDYRWKFCGQIFAVLVVMHGGILIQHVPLMGFESIPYWLSYPLTFIFILGVTNAVNLSDGLDGLAAGTTLLALAVIFALTQLSNNDNAAFIALTSIGGILGFLRYNTFPARVFMGDAGSQFLGFITGCLSIFVTQAETCPVSPALPLLVLGLPVLDTVMVMVIRIAQKRSPFAPDRNHLHHQIMALGFRHNEAVAIIYLLQMALLALAFILRFAHDGLLLGAYGIFAAALIGSLTITHRSGWRFRTNLSQQTFIDRRNFLLRKFEWFYRNSTLIIQVSMVLLLVTPTLLLRQQQLSLSSLNFVFFAILAIVAATYKRFTAWGARLSIYSASVLSIYLATNPQLHEWSHYINVMFIGLAIMLAFAIRMTRREHFRLDTQDLLILVMILVVPLLPIDAVNRYAVGEFTLRLAVLMYSCEFIIGKSAEKKLLPITIAAISSILLTIALHGVLFNF